MKNVPALRIVAVIGLALGGVFGLAGTMVEQANLRSLFWGIDGAGLVVATAILALQYFRRGNDALASGFLVFAIGEGVILTSAAAPLDATGPPFAAGAALWSAGLLLTSIPPGFALWTRAAGAIGGILFAITSARILWGEQVLPTSSPLPYFAYPFLVLSFIGWIWSVLRA
jgi:hypothetical protein